MIRKPGTAHVAMLVDDGIFGEGDYAQALLHDAPIDAGGSSPTAVYIACAATVVVPVGVGCPGLNMW